MAISILQVQSGEIIAASLMNQIIQALSNLDTRVSKLEGTATATAGTPHIQGISPTSGVHVGDQLTVTGTNLWAAGVNTVYIDLSGTLTQVTQFVAQSDNTLVFNIPMVFVQGGGSSVYLRIVSPTQGSDAIQFTLLPAAVTIPTGLLLVQMSAQPNTVFNAPGSGVATYTLNYTILSNTDLGDTYDLKPTVATAGWTTTILDNSTGQPTQNATVYIPPAPSASQSVITKGSLQVSIPAAATGSAKLTLTVTSHLNPTGLSQPAAVMIPVGGSVLLSAGIGVMPQPRPQDVDSHGNLLVPVTGGLQLIFQITAATAGLYNLSFKFDGAGWSASVPATVQIPTANQPTTLSTTLNTTSGAQPSNFYLTVSLSTDLTGQTATQAFYPVVVKS